MFGTTLIPWQIFSKSNAAIQAFIPGIAKPALCMSRIW